MIEYLNTFTASIVKAAPASTLSGAPAHTPPTAGGSLDPALNDGRNTLCYSDWY